MEEKHNNIEKTQLTLKHSKKKQNNSYRHTQLLGRKLGHGSKHAQEPKLGDKVVLPYPRAHTPRKHNLTTHRVPVYKGSENVKCPSMSSA